MLNHIWFWLLVIGIVYGGAEALVSPESVGRSLESGVRSPEAAKQPASPVPDSSSGLQTLPSRLTALRTAGGNLSTAMLEAAKAAVELCLGLVGVMVLWLGMLKIAEDAGMVAALAKLLRPVMRWLFPEVPDGHPAQGAMLMNLSANMLGLDNAATPLGLAAMRELQTLNPHKETATNAMAMFLAINTSSITIIPISIIALRVAAGSKNAAAPLGAILIGTVCSTAIAIVVVRWMQNRKRYALPSAAELNAEGV